MFVPESGLRDWQRLKLRARYLKLVFFLADLPPVQTHFLALHIGELHQVRGLSEHQLFYFSHWTKPREVVVDGFQWCAFFVGQSLNGLDYLTRVGWFSGKILEELLSGLDNIVHIITELRDIIIFSFVVLWVLVFGLVVVGFSFRSAERWRSLVGLNRTSGTQSHDFVLGGRCYQLVAVVILHSKRRVDGNP